MTKTQHLFAALLLIGAAACAAPIAVLAQTAASAATAVQMTEGEIRKIDKSTKKLTIKHGEIKHLDMPGMTMLFEVKESAMLDQVRVGDKVRFMVENVGGAFVVTAIQVAP